MKICLECEGISDTAQIGCASCGVPLQCTSAVHFPLRRGEADAGHPLLGTVIDGKYLVQSVLGKGGMGTVFRAMHRVSLVPVAIKILHPRFSARREYRDYFLAEARKAGRVTHEHVGRILDVGEAEDGTVYIAMEEVSGATLHECIYGDPRLSPELIVEILHQVCQALAAAHGAGLVHRDLSPRNIMIAPRHGVPFLKILDFGIAKGLPQDHGAAGGLEAPPGFANPPYSAPEQLEARDVDARADLYSLGVIAYEALGRQLPVEGETTKERARSTVRGELRPLVAPPGTPPRLLRLVRSLLARDPEGRPPSAEAVLAELQRIQQPTARRLRDVAVMVAAFAVVVLAASYVLPTDTYLQIRPSGSRLAVRTTMEELPRPQHLASSQLDRLIFDYNGFDARDLVVLGNRDGRELFRIPIPASAAADGTLTLDRRIDPGYLTFLRRLALHSREGPVVLTFLVPGKPALGVASVLLDDEPPRLALSQVGGGGDLNAASRLHIACEDFGNVVALELRCAVAGGDLIRVPLHADSLGEDVDARRLLEAMQVGVEPLLDVGLTLSATDAAGNTATSRELRFRRLDFRLPTVLSQEGSLRAAMIAQSEPHAQLSLRISAPEDGLQAWLGREGVPGARHPVEVRTHAHQVDLQIPKAAVGDFETGRFSIWLRDPAGNELRIDREVTFHGEEPDFLLIEPVGRGPESFLPGAAGPAVARLDRQLVWSGAATSFEFRCNAFYRPIAAQLYRDGVPLADTTVILSESRHGGGRLTFAALDSDRFDGLANLAVEVLPDVPRPLPEARDWEIRVLVAAPRLQVPAAAAAPYLVQLNSGGVFVEQSRVGRLRQIGQGAGWVLSPPDTRLLHGTALWGGGSPELLVDVALAPREQPDDPVLGPHPVREGQNLLCLDLRDPFGRAVPVFLGNERAPILNSSGRRGLAQIALFESWPEVAPPPTDPLILEYQQVTRLRLISPYHFTAGDRPEIRVWFRGEALRCERLRAVLGGGTQLEFALPFAQMAQASPRRATPEDLQRPGLRFAIGLRLETPAGDVMLADLPVETTRSSLRAVRMGRDFGVTDPLLSKLGMVPVIRPLDAFPDPVSAERRRRGRFLRKAPVTVKFLADCYLQDREMTRAEYARILSRFLRLPGRPPATTIVFPGDPAGPARVERMVPRLHDRRPEDWERELREAPEAAVTGVDFYQAYAIARMAGQVLLGDPTALRLPFGVEMELAALGTEPSGALNGLGGRRTLGELPTLGDAVETGRGAIAGLDFGVREWVLDLPWPRADNQRPIVAEWMSDHETHRARALGFVELPDLAAGLREELLQRGVVRGLSVGEPDKFVDVDDERRIARGAKVTPGVPGVVRTDEIDRDGEGIFPGSVDGLLRWTGLRLAGGATFVQRVRSR